MFIDLFFGKIPDCFVSNHLPNISKLSYNSINMIVANIIAKPSKVFISFQSFYCFLKTFYFGGQIFWNRRVFYSICLYTYILTNPSIPEN